MATRFAPLAAPSSSHEAAAQPHCEVCGEPRPAVLSDIEEVFSRRYTMVHGASGPRVVEEYVCPPCGLAFLADARLRADLAEEEG